MKICKVSQDEFDNLWNKLYPQERYRVDHFPCSMVLLNNVQPILVTTDIVEVGDTASLPERFQRKTKLHPELDKVVNEMLKAS